MSRLIDADALMADCQLAQKQASRHDREFANAFYSGGGEISTEWWCVEDMIENAPTIEERKVGKWIREDIVLTSIPPQYQWHCSECEYLARGFSPTKLTNYCPNCGAKMEGNV